MDLNGSHLAVGVGSAAVVAPLGIVFQHFQAVDAGTAGAEALLIALALHVIGVLIAPFLPPQKPAATPAGPEVPAPPPEAHP